MKISKFYLKDVRCFAGPQEFNIRPLTFLVGENSTGKSTVLGCMQGLGDFINERHFSTNLDFNQNLYQMGSYQEIVRKSRPLKDFFQLGFQIERPSANPLDYLITLVERGGGSEPIIDNIEWRFSKGSVIVEYNQISSENNIFTITISEKENRTIFNIIKGKKYPSDLEVDFSRLIFTLKIDPEAGIISESHKKLLSFLEKESFIPRPRFYGNLPIPEMESFAPIRSKLQRTYDPLPETPTPDGSEMPMRLMNLQRNDDEQWKALRSQLVDFGKNSGLFSDLEVKALGRSSSHPFQLRIKAHGTGSKVNLLDTGYGSSQILPILVRILASKRNKGTIYLMQQPEVHLHPRGQAALSSLFISILQNKPRRPSGFVVETHSDYMIDRARIEIQRGSISPEDVSLIYLEPADPQGVKVHNITFDQEGNMEGVPDSYRGFFLKEADALLGFT